MGLPFVSRRTHESTLGLYSVALDRLRQRDRDYAYEHNRAAAFESMLREAGHLINELRRTGTADSERVDRAGAWIDSMLSAHGERERLESHRQAREEAGS